MIDMTKKISKANEKQQKTQQAIGLLKFIIDLDDEEIVKTTIEAVIDLLEEISK